MPIGARDPRSMALFGWRAVWAAHQLILAEEGPDAVVGDGDGRPTRVVAQLLPQPRHPRRLRRRGGGSHGRCNWFETSIVVHTTHLKYVLSFYYSGISRKG